MRVVTAMLLVVTLATGYAVLSPPPSQANEAAGNVAGLQDILEKGLKARLPQDFAFINRVVEMVRNNELPRDLVLGTFDWVRKNKGNKKYMMAYFMRVMRLRAAEIGVQI